MSLLKLLTEQQLSLFHDKKEILDRYFSDARIGDVVEYHGEIKTLNDAKSLWRDITEEVYTMVYEESDIDPYATDFNGLIYTFESAVVDNPDFFLKQIKDLDNEEMKETFNLLADITEEEDRDGEITHDDILDLLQTVTIEDFYRESTFVDDFIELLYNNFYLEDFVFNSSGNEFFKELIIGKIESEGALQNDGDSGIDEMWYDMEQGAESINGVDHIYAERMIRFKDPEELEVYKSLGVFWSWRKDGANAYSGSGRNSIIFKGMVPVSSIDWKTTFVINLYNLAYEKEVRLDDNRGMVLLREVEYEFSGSSTLSDKVMSVVKVYFGRRLKNNDEDAFTFKRQVMKYFRNKDESVLNSNNITLHLFDEEYYDAYHEANLNGIKV